MSREKKEKNRNWGIMSSVKKNFERRKYRARKKISETTDRPRLSVFKSNRHFYAQIIDQITGNVLVSIATVEKSFSKPNKSNRNKEIAKILGDEIGKRAKKKKVEAIVFDKSGYKYHGVLKEFADAARKHINF